MGGAIYLGPNYGEVMKRMGTSFKRSHVCAAMSSPSPAAARHWPMPPLETPGHSRASLGQSLVGSLLLYPGSWCTQVSVCALQDSISQSYVSAGSSMAGLRATSSKRASATPRSAAPRAPALQQTTADPNLRRRHSDTVLSQSPWGPWVLVHTKFEPSERLWQKWGLILNANSPLLPSCWAFSFALGHGLSPYSCSRATQQWLESHLL